jgi:hypothetical protein
VQGIHSCCGFCLDSSQPTDPCAGDRADLAHALQVLLLMQVPPASEDDRLAKAALYTKYTGGLATAHM